MSNQEPCCEFWKTEYSFTQSCFPIGTRFCDDGFEYCNEQPSNGDCECCGPRDRPCITCYICLSPIGLAIDIITIPFRTTYCIYLQCKKCMCNKNTRIGAYTI